MSVSLRVENVSLSIEDTSILESISFAVAEQSIVGIIGPNGSGKTSLFNCLSGFSHHTGKVFVEDREVSSLTANERARAGLGRVFQNLGIFRSMTVLENMLCAIENRQGSGLRIWSSLATRRGNNDEAMTYLSQINLSEMADKRAASLSGGQLRLLEIIRTVAFGASCLLLDEPTAGVAPKMKEAVSQLIQSIRRAGKTILIIEHDIELIQSFADRIIALNAGSVLLDDAPQNVINDRRLQELYFGNSAA